MAETIDDAAEARMPAVPSKTPLGNVIALPSRSGGRYGEGRRFNLPVVAATVLIHAILLAAVAHVRSEIVRKESPRLIVVNLKQPEPPPPTAAQPPPPPKAAIVAPVPLLEVPHPTPPPVATISIPTPQPPSPSVPAAPAPTAAPSTVKAGDLGTRMVAGAPPRYPMESRRGHEQGTVVLGLILDVDGKVASISIVRSSGYSRLDEAALRAVRRWRWAPIVRNGQPVMVQGEVEIPFVLRG